VRKLIFIEEKFLDPILCEPFINLAKKNDKEMPYGDESRGGDTFLTTVTHSNPDESLSKGMDVPEPDGNYGAIYLGGNVDPTTIEVDDNELFKTVIHGITDLCKSFDPDIVLDYVGVVRWPSGTFMKPHFDKNDIHGPDVFAAMLYLNDDFSGGHTCFEDFDVAPEPGKLIIFSNSQYLHHVNKVEDGERFVLSFWYKRLTPSSD
tara:strand:- start:579 stop:1193 length:615 start_codon:yes stop_codon:yes gene_type:complete